MYTSHQNITYLHYLQGPFHKYHYEGWPPWLATMLMLLVLTLSWRCRAGMLDM